MNAVRRVSSAARAARRHVAPRGVRRARAWSASGLATCLLAASLAGCGAPASDTGADLADLGAASTEPEIPSWVDLPLQRDEGRWLLVGVGSGVDREAALVAARADALREFRRLQAFHVDDTLRAAHRELEDAPRELIERLDDDALRAEAVAQLDAAESLPRAFDMLGADGAHQAWQRVALDELRLYPDVPIERLLRQPKMVDRSLRFVEEAVRADEAELPRWSQLALLLAELDRDLPVDVLLRMARTHAGRQRPLSAKRLLDRARGLVSKRPEENAERQRVQAFAQQLLGNVPPVAESVTSLAELTAELSRPELLRVDAPPKRSAPRATTFMSLRVGRLPTRLLALWLEDGELVQLPLPEHGRVRSLGAYHLGLALSADFNGARLFAWSLPVESPVWRAAEALGEGVIDVRPDDPGVGAARESHASEHARLALHTLVTRLRDARARPDVAAVVVKF